MEKSTKEKNEQIAQHAFEKISNLIVSFIPTLQILTFWNFRSELKQKRLLDFADSLKKVFERELHIDLDNYNFESEDFVDLFDSIMGQVQLTKSEKKLNAFRGIFVNALITNSYDSTQIYIDLTTNLHEKQIEILNSFIITNDDKKKSLEELNQLSNLQKEKEEYKNHIREQAKKGTIKSDQSILLAERDEEQVSTRLEEAREYRKRLVDSINPDLFNIDKSEYNYFIRDLISKGLLIENTYVTFETTVVESIDPTDFALGYYEFVTI